MLLLCFSIWQTASARNEEKRKKDQVKIWMQQASGISNGLSRIVQDNLDHRYSSTNDMANAVWSMQANAFSLYQSLYEERCLSEDDYKMEQKELRQNLKNNQSLIKSTTPYISENKSELVEGLNGKSPNEAGHEEKRK